MTSPVHSHSLQSDTYFQTLKCLCFHQDCYEGGAAGNLSVQLIGIPSPHEPTNLPTPGIRGERKLTKPLQTEGPGRNCLLIVYRGDVGVTDQTRMYVTTCSETTTPTLRVQELPTPILKLPRRMWLRR
jgi:hypothetical protein